MTTRTRALPYGRQHAEQQIPVDVARARFPGLRLPVGFTSPVRIALWRCSVCSATPSAGSR
ncbi:hypothetical protein NE236_33050 [Actinoallomurus purpureus]|uniref:hypothetical protein n=1 Tax=Actinoallomurus purpureus TaxID=478114 RepID=UPI0020930C04|nr:hypothetical protein [Actinoallomurus purpureus]MCO6009811.1 hypothetical protein [Actinoallomurus purpureus]